MPKQMITGLADHGWIPDAAPNTLPVNAWTQADNWTFSDKGYPEVSKGYTNALQLKTNRQSLSENGTFVYQWTALTGVRRVIYVSDTGNIRLLSDSSNSITDTTVDTVLNAANVAYSWNATDSFSRPILNNGRDAPFAMITDTTMGHLPNWPSANYCRFFTSFRGAFMVAVGLDGGKTIRFSDGIESPGTFPTWGPHVAGATNSYTGYSANGSSTSTISIPDDTLSTDIDLSLHTSGELLSAIEVNNVLYVFTTVNIVAITYEGVSNDVPIFNSTVIHTDNGALGNKSMCAVPGGFAVMAPNQFYTVAANYSDYEGQSKKVLGDGKWIETWTNTVNHDRLDEIQLVYNALEEEVWIKTPTGSSGNEIWRYNLKLDAVSRMTDHGEIRFLEYSKDGLPAAPLTIDTLPSSWTIDTIPFANIDELPVFTRGIYPNRIISIGGPTRDSGLLFIHDFGATYNGRDIQAYLRRDAMVLKQSARELVSINRVIPFTETESDNATLDVTVGKSKLPHGSPTFVPAKTFNVMNDTKLDFRVNSRYPAIQFYATSAGLALHSYELDITMTDRR